MLVKPNVFVHSKTNNAKQILEKHSSRVLVPDRIWCDTAHVITLLSYRACYLKHFLYREAQGLR